MDSARSTDGVRAAILLAVGATLELATMGAAVSVLVVAQAMAFAIWVARPEWTTGSRVLPVYVAAVVVQCAHPVEEYSTEFYRAFPPVLGRDP